MCKKKSIQEKTKIIISFHKFGSINKKYIVQNVNSFPYQMPSIYWIHHHWIWIQICDNKETSEWYFCVYAWKNYKIRLNAFKWKIVFKKVFFFSFSHIFIVIIVIVYVEFRRRKKYGEGVVGPFLSKNNSLLNARAIVWDDKSRIGARKWEKIKIIFCLLFGLQTSFVCVLNEYRNHWLLMSWKGKCL